MPYKQIPQLPDRAERLRLHSARRGGEDLFVHYIGIEGSGFRSLEEGDKVSYEPTRGRKGEQAENMR